jgi:hypothetical protein
VAAAVTKEATEPIATREVVRRIFIRVCRGNERRKLQSDKEGCLLISKAFRTNWTNPEVERGSLLIL